MRLLMCACEVRVDAQVIDLRRKAVKSSSSDKPAYTLHHHTCMLTHVVALGSMCVEGTSIQ